MSLKETEQENLKKRGRKRRSIRGDWEEKGRGRGRGKIIGKERDKVNKIICVAGNNNEI